MSIVKCHIGSTTFLGQRRCLHAWRDIGDREFPLPVSKNGRFRSMVYPIVSAWNWLRLDHRIYGSRILQSHILGDHSSSFQGAMDCKEIISAIYTQTMERRSGI